jgi:3'-5' exoribonuclease
MFPEALLLHYMDDLDSKMESMRAHFERESELETAWSSYNASLGRPLLNTAKFLAPKPTPAAEPTAVSESAAAPEPDAEPVIHSETLPLTELNVPANGEQVGVAVAQPTEKS